MFAAFFTKAAQSPGRQKALRRAVATHVLFVAITAWLLDLGPQGGTPLVLFGQFLLIAGIVEGATLIGWRLTQLPKSRALEFLLVSPVRPARVLLGEAAVGLAMLGLVTLSSLPILSVLAWAGMLTGADVLLLLAMPFLWGAVLGLTVTVWAYEPAIVKRWGERVLFVLVLIYLVVGVMAAERLHFWLLTLPTSIGQPLYTSLIFCRDYNPFGMMRLWMESRSHLLVERALLVQLGGLAVLSGLLWRAACRLEPHFQERHYQPAFLRNQRRRAPIAERPLTWWAVKRVSEFSGRINLWLAGGFCLLYALYTLAGPDWPTWMGRGVFTICDRYAGLAGLATALVVLAATPAAFQYGLWDSCTQDRCRRLELLLLTQLDARDYWDAATRAAWNRGAGYFAIALMLWLAALFAGQVTVSQVATTICAGVLLWGLYFALGFHAFSRGMQANGLGLALTVGLPLATIVCYRAGFPGLAALMPTGSVYGLPTSPLIGAGATVLLASLTLLVARRGQRHCDGELRRWYDQNVGSKVLS